MMPNDYSNCHNVADDIENAKGDRYRGTKTETIDYMEQITQALCENGVKANIICNVVMALKYLSSRLGAKDDVFVELEKAENYIHRARTGHWMTEEK